MIVISEGLSLAQVTTYYRRDYTQGDYYTDGRRHLDAAGLSLPVLGAILGHRSQATTARYAHLADDPRQAGAARISSEIAAALNGWQAAEVIPCRGGAGRGG